MLDSGGACYGPVGAGGGSEVLDAGWTRMTGK